MKFIAVFVLAVGMLAVVGCGDDDKPNPTSTPVSTASGSPIPTPDSVALAAVRPAIAAIESSDVARLKALILLSSYACSTKAQGPGSDPACPPGIAEGTPVQVFPTAGCEGEFVFPSDLDRVLSGQGGSVYGAFKRSAARGPYEPPYGIVSNTPPIPGSKVSNPGGLWGVDASGRITSFSSQCGANAREIADQALKQGVTWVIAPTTVGIPIVDAVIEAVLANDAAGLKANFAYFKARCATNPGGGIPQPPKCLAGETDGTLVDVLLAVPGEGLYFRPSEADRELAGWLSAGMRLYSVKDLGTVTDILGVPRYHVVFVNKDGSGHSLTLSNLGVVGLFFDQSRNPESQAQLFTGMFLVPPQN